MIATLTALALAAIFDFILFRTNVINFWWGMAIANGALAIVSIVRALFDGRHLFSFRIRYIAWGIVSAVILYFLFRFGNFLLGKYYPALAVQTASLYGLKELMDERIIAPLLFFIIAPGEEIFWRGMIQRTLANNFGEIIGWIAGAMLYAAVHLWAGKPVLFGAAVVGGLYWGFLFKRFGALWPGIVSHAIWGLLIFILYPL